MIKRIQRFAAIASMGLCFQLVGCESNDILEAIAAGTKDVAVEITAIFLDAAVDDIFELN